MLNAQGKAYHILLKSNLKKYPIDVFKFKIPGAAWKIMTKAEARASGILNTEFLREAAEKFIGLTIPVKENRYIIIYDESLSVVERDAVIMHEIGHIAYGYSEYNGVLGKSKDSEIESTQEKEADVFSLTARAAACVLIDDGVAQSDMITRVTYISEDEAELVENELKRLKGLKKTKLERELSMKFDTKRYRRGRKLRRYTIAAAIGAVVSAIMITTVGVITSYYKEHSVMIGANPQTITYVTQNGDSFHKGSDCYTLRGAAVLEISITDAILDGYGACKICNPLEVVK